MAERSFAPQRIAANLAIYYEKGFDSLWNSGQKLQREVLAEILEAATGTEYATEHGFSGASPDEFLERTPVSDYSDYMPYIKRNMETGGRELTQLPISSYLISSGSCGRDKFIPETQIANAARRVAINAWNMIVIQKEPIMASPEVKMLAVVNNTPLESAPNGVPVKRASGQEAKPLWDQFPTMYVHPFEFFEVDCSTDERSYLLALYTLREKNLDLLFCNNLGYFGVLLDIIDANGERIINDIRNGGASIALCATDREKLAESLAPNAARADELEAALSEDGKLEPAKIWPRLSFAGVWMSGTVGAFSEDTRHRLPSRVRYLSEGYGASEGMFTIPIEFDTPDGPLATFDCYYEFLPIDAPFGTLPIPMSEVTEGNCYELVVTTYSGLYRYNLHDVVRVNGFVGDTACIQFCCRSDDSLDVGGNRIYATKLFETVKRACSESASVPRMYQMTESSGCVDLLIEFDERPEDDTTFRNCISEEFQNSGLSLGRVYLMKDGWRQSCYDARKQGGRNEQTLKLSPIAKTIPHDFVETML